MKQRSLKINMVLNAIKGLLSVVFPLITFPYVSRVLGVDEIGRYNFANSIISYFVLIAGLGISSYSIREGARFRDDKGKLQPFVNEMFSINIASTLAAYLLLLVVMLVVHKFWNYKILLIIFSLQIGFKLIGIEWLYSIYEDYLYITIRSILFQLMSFFLLFKFVRTGDDVNIYAAITVFSGVGSNVLNYVHARKYCKVGFTKNIDWKSHMKPIMVLFAMSVTVTIYVSSDTTILGFLCTDYEVGIYSASVKIYNIVKNILSSVIIVSIPRLSSILGKNNRKEFSIVASDIYKTLITIMLPAIVGIIVLRKEIILLVCGQNYLDAVPSLVLLSVALIFSMASWFWGQAILIPAKREDIVLKATIISALVNIVLNFVLIPFWKENAAAFTTLLAETIAYLISRKEGVKFAKLEGVVSVTMKVVIGCVAIIGVSFAIWAIKDNWILYTALSIVLSVIAYTTVEIILKNESVLSIWSGLKGKLLH